MKHFFRRTRLAAAVLPFLLAASAACDIAMVDHREKATEEWTKTYDIQAGGRVEIANVNGKVDVRPGDGTKVEVVAQKTASGQTQEAAREALKGIEITEEATASSLKIGTKMQRSGGLFNHGSLQVVYTVRVPATMEVHLSTVNGGLEITGVQGKIVAETTNGGVKARDIGGAIEATATNGGVDVDLARVVEGIKLETVNGGVVLRLPTDAKATIAARVVNGGIETSGL